MKIMLIGLGRWGYNHLRLLLSLPIDLYVADTDPKRLADAVKAGILPERAASDYRQFRDSVDAAVVVTPAQSHFAICNDLLDAGKDVFVEKPLTIDPTEARQLSDKAKLLSRIVQVGHIFRFDPASTWISEAIARGDFGAVRMIRADFSGFKRPRNDTGVMLADAIHFVDLCNYFLHANPNRVSAHLMDGLGRGMEDSAVVVLDYDLPAGHVQAVVESNYFIPGKHRSVVVVGEKLTAECDFNASQYKIKASENRHEVKGLDAAAIEGTVHQIESTPEEPLRAELTAFLDSVKTRKLPLADAEVGYDAVRILDAAYRSVKEQRTITL